MIHIYYTSFSELFSPEKWDAYLNEFAPEIRQKILRYRMPQKQHQALLGKLLVKRILQKYNITKTDLSDLKYTSKGKPYFENVPFHFNISHSANTIMCAFSEMPVGIDVEKIRALKITDFRLFFSPSEILHIQEDSNSLHAFFRFWTLKESILKLTGEGISADLLAFEIEKEKVIYFGKSYFYETEHLDVEHIFTVTANERIEKEIQYFHF